MAITFEDIEAAVPIDEFPSGRNADAEAGYENSARYVAKVYLAAARRDPVVFRAALDDYRESHDVTALDALLTPEEYRVAIADAGITGFQWGWAMNTVAYLLEQEQVPNHALINLSAGPGDSAVSSLKGVLGTRS